MQRHQRSPNSSRASIPPSRSAAAAADIANREVRPASSGPQRPGPGSGRNPRTSAPLWTRNRAVSNDSTGATPVVPARSRAQKASRSCPTAVTRPIPVITTRGRISARLPDQLALDELDGILDALHPRLHVLLLRLQAELVLDDHQRLDDREGVQAEVLDESS